MSVTHLVSLQNLTQIHSGLWKIQLSPQELREEFGNAKSSIGVHSIILVENAIFNKSNSSLECEAKNIWPLNVGTGSVSYVISAGQVPTLSEKPSDPLSYSLGKGDEEFLRMCENSLSPDMFLASRDLLEGVRLRSSGNLKRGNLRNFSETPDNFWYVIIQPRINQLQITVRGDVEHFSGVSNLEIKDDRGNSRFKVKSQSDTVEALKLIFSAKRKTS